jgi:hypothetical protein
VSADGVAGFDCGGEARTDDGSAGGGGVGAPLEVVRRNAMLVRVR